MHEESFWANPRTWVAVAFVIFFVLFGRKIWAALTKLLDDRASTIRAELEEASRLRREAEEMLREAQIRRAAALAEAKALIEGARAEAARFAAAAAADAEAAGRRRERMALERIAAAEKAAIDDVRITAADIATMATRQVIAETLTPGADAVLVDRAIASLPAALRSA